MPGRHLQLLQASLQQKRRTSRVEISILLSGKPTEVPKEVFPKKRQKPEVLQKQTTKSHSKCLASQTSPQTSSNGPTSSRPKNRSLGSQTTLKEPKGLSRRVEKYTQRQSKRGNPSGFIHEGPLYELLLC